MNVTDRQTGLLWQYGANR